MSDEVQLPPDPEENRLPLEENRSQEVIMPGRRLKAVREARGVSVAEVAHALKFGVRQVEALEADDYSNLQGATFQRGFIRSYARYLKEDPAPLLALLDVSAPPAEAEIVAPSNMGAAVSEPFLQRNQRWVLLLLALVAVGAVGAYWLTQQDGSAPSKTETESTVAPPAPSEAQPTVVAPTPVPLNPSAAPEATPGAQPLFPPAPAAPSAPAAPAPQATPAPVAPPASAAPAAPVVRPAPVPPAVPVAPAPPAVRPGAAAVPAVPGASAPVATPAPAPKIALDFDGRSWVEIKDATQRVVFTGEYGAGTHQVVYGKPPFQLWIGKTSAVRVSYNEQKVNLQPHTRDEVARLTLE